MRDDPSVKILLTAFEPYEQWTDNSSWLTMVELLKRRPANCQLVTRRYPVDLPGVRESLHRDLEQGFDAVLHLGQAPGSTAIKLETVAINFAGRVDNSGEELNNILEDSPLAYRSQLPVGNWANILRQNDIPATVSYHAGTFLCNATMFLSLHQGQRLRHAGRVGFIHLPLTTRQAASGLVSMPSLPVEVLASAVRMIIDDLVRDLASSRTEDRMVAGVSISEGKKIVG